MAIKPVVRARIDEHTKAEAEAILLPVWYPPTIAGISRMVGQKSARQDRGRRGSNPVVGLGKRPRHKRRRKAGSIPAAPGSGRPSERMDLRPSAGQALPPGNA